MPVEKDNFKSAAGVRSRARDILASSLAPPSPSIGLETMAEGGLEERLTFQERFERSEAWMAAFIAQLGEEGSGLLDMRDKLLADGKRGLDRIASDGPDVMLDAESEIGIEAIIETDGSRPVLLVQDDALNSGAVALTGQWQTLLATYQQEIQTIVRAVGRVNDPAHPQRFQGTAFMVAPGIVMTNRHVLQGIANETDGAWQFKPDITVDFAQEYKRARTSRFAVEELIFTGPQPIDHWSIDHDLLDLALLRIKDGSPDRSWPLPLPITIRPEAGGVPRAVVVSGFPGDPYTHEPADLKKKLFELIFGYKILAPGRVKRAAGEIGGNTKKWSIGHDATTLPGNSGSCIIDIESGAEVAALHYAGAPRSVNFAHVLALVGGEPVPGTGQDLLGYLKGKGAAIRS